MPSTKPNAQELVDRLTPGHLSADALREEMEQQGEKKAAEAVPPEEGGKHEREYTWTFRWKDGRGRVWEGEFTNKVLPIRDRQRVGQLQARLAGGIPYEQLDPDTRGINRMIAHLTFSLKKRPKWAEDLQALEDVQLLSELYVEVIDHESTFLGLNAPAAESEI
ncbi:MAG: hypothetical protein WC789_07040 [Lentisphaeria bacterium]|jgi:hypothetical protein